MNVSEKRIIKLAIILFTIGLVFRYLPWGLPSIESFEVGEAFVVANASSPLLEKDVPDTIASADSGDVVNKINTSTELVQTIDQAGAVLDYEICESVIRTTRRMTYTAVNRILEDHDPETLYRKQIR